MDLSGQLLKIIKLFFTPEELIKLNTCLPAIEVSVEFQQVAFHIHALSVTHCGADADVCRRDVRRTVFKEYA